MSFFARLHFTQIKRKFLLTAMRRINRLSLDVMDDPKLQITPITLKKKEAVVYLAIEQHL